MAGLKQLNWASEGVGATAAALVDLSTVAGNKISNPPWVKFQSAGWVNFPSAPTLIEALHERCFKVAVETNGTITAPLGIDWLCVSPKGLAEIKQRSGQELKLVMPQPELDPRDFESWEFERFFLQAMDGPDHRRNLAIAIAYCQANPQWSLSVQVHKSIGIR